MYWKTIVGIVQRGVTQNKVESCAHVGDVIWLGTTLNWVSSEVQVDRGGQVAIDTFAIQPEIGYNLCHAITCESIN